MPSSGQRIYGDRDRETSKEAHTSAHHSDITSRGVHYSGERGTESAYSDCVAFTEPSTPVGARPAWPGIPASALNMSSAVSCNTPLTSFQARLPSSTPRSTHTGSAAPLARQETPAQQQLRPSTSPANTSSKDRSQALKLILKDEMLSEKSLREVEERHKWLTSGIRKDAQGLPQQVRCWYD